jgi:glycosyltransferase involved in cell wall biosynthesis
MMVSVIIPCRNAGQWVEEALNSVLSQTLPPHEIVVADDDSEDDSVDKIRAFGSKVKLIRVSDHHPAAARNACLERCTGDWIAFLDADDKWYPNHLENATSALADTTDVAFMAHFEKDEEVVAPLPLDIATSGIEASQYVAWLSQRIYFAINSCVVSRSALVDIGGFDTTLRCEDLNMWLQLTHDKTWSYNPVASSLYRSTPGSVSKDRPGLQEGLLRVILKNQPLYESPEMNALLHYAAQAAMHFSIIEGTKADRETARSLAWDHLTRFEQALFYIGGRYPNILKLAAWCRRTILHQTP